MFIIGGIKMPDKKPIGFTLWNFPPDKELREQAQQEAGLDDEMAQRIQHCDTVPEILDISQRVKPFETPLSPDWWCR